MSTFENIETLMDRTRQVSGNQELNERQPDYLDDNLLYVRDVEKIPELYGTKVYANIICICVAGTMEVLLNGEHCTIEAGDVLVCPSNATVERPMLSPDFKFSIVAFTDTILHELLGQNMDIWNKAMYIRKGHVMKATNDAEREVMMESGTHMMALLQLILNHRELAFRRQMICSLVQIILLSYCSVQHEIEKEVENNPAEQTRQMASTTIFNNFMTLLRNEEQKHQPVSYYADQLFITPKHLTFVCKKVSGRPATELIQAAVTEDILRYLRNPKYTVKQIAMKLGFDNISFFGKFVKKHLGMSPNDYRKRMLAPGIVDKAV